MASSIGSDVPIDLRMIIVPGPRRPFAAQLAPSGSVPSSRKVSATSSTQRLSPSETLVCPS